MPKYANRGELAHALYLFGCSFLLLALGAILALIIALTSMEQSSLLFSYLVLASIFVFTGLFFAIAGIYHFSGKNRSRHSFCLRI